MPLFLVDVEVTSTISVYVKAKDAPSAKIAAEDHPDCDGFEYVGATVVRPSIPCVPIWGRLALERISFNASLLDKPHV